MKYCRLQTLHGPQYAEVVDRGGRLWIERLIPPFEEGPASDYVDRATPFDPVPFDEARILAPVAPSKIVCVGRNYREHAAELGNEVPAEPLLFFKPPSALIAPAEPIRIPSLSKRVDFEGEIAIVIGERCRNIGPGEDPRDYIRGYTIANDVTARDLQRRHDQWFKGKSLDTTLPLGPCLVSSDEISDPKMLELSLTVNGQERQRARVEQMIFDIPTIISTLSAGLTLLPGDIIATGTPSGVGFAMTPPHYLHDGDEMVARIDRIGELRNRVVEV
jgi:2-keto-4-pentenoate hydratase/2-oxohepta-3-ene-1,7-dioic acid hydratase in catechol pathway